MAAREPTVEAPRGGAERSELELDAATMRAMVEQAMARIVPHLESLPSQPAASVDGGAELARSLVEDLPEDGRPFADLLALLFDRLVPCSFNTAGPGYLAYIPGGGLFHAAVADLVADAVNRYIGVWLAAPGLVQLEVNVVRWLCQMVGYPAASGGILTSGGSLANFTALVTARRERLGDDFRHGRLYASDQVHHSVVKAAQLAGFPAASVRRIGVDEGYRVRLAELAAAVADDRARGLAPFLVVGSAGTTNTGAVDDLAGLADLARGAGLWLHIDAAYGGFFVLTERGRRLLRGMELADTITLDPHKGLFLPYGTGGLLVRDAAALRRAHAVAADYMPALQSAPDLVDFCEISPELSRGFRGLRVWLPLAMHGARAFREALDEKLDLARWAAAELETIDGVEIVAPPQLSIVAFRLRAEGAAPAERDALNRRLLAAVNSRRRVYLTGTLVGAGFVLRICVLSFRTHRERMEMCLEDLRAAVAEVTGAP